MQKEQPNVETEAQQPDQIQQAINTIAARKVKLVGLKQQNPKEYDRFLRTGFPLEVYTLLERVTIELANRNTAILEILAEAEAEHAQEMAAQFAEEHEEAIRALALFVQGLDMELPQDVQEALEIISDEGILDEESDEGQTDEEAGAASEAPQQEKGDDTTDGDDGDGTADGDDDVNDTDDGGAIGGDTDSTKGEGTNEPTQA